MIKRLLYFFFISIVYCDISYADNYAFLISAGKATLNNVCINAEHWNDLFLIYEYLLLEEHYDSSKVYVFYGDGIDYNNPTERYRKELHNWGQITDYDNYFSTINNIIPSLNNIITDEDNILFYWVVGHGEIENSNVDNYNATITHNNDITEYVSKTQLMSLINSITHYKRRKIIWMTCYAGAMGSGYINPLNNRTTLIASSASYEESHSHAFLLGDTFYYHSDFNYSLFSLSTGKLPNGSACIYDQYYNSGTVLEDSLLSVNELFLGTYTFVCSIPYNNSSNNGQHPCLFDSGNISDRIYLGENKEIKNVAIGNNKSYWLDRLELSNVTLGTGTDITIDTDIQTVIKKNTIVPKGSTLSIE